MDNPFAATFNLFHTQFTQAVRDLTGLAKEHHAAADLETRISGVLRTFVNNMQSTQSALFFDMVNYNPPPPYESAIPVRQPVNLPKIQPMENPFRDSGTGNSVTSARLEPPSKQSETKTVKVTDKSQLLMHPRDALNLDFRNGSGVYDKSAPHGTAANTLDKYLKFEAVEPNNPVQPVSLEPSPESGRQDRYDHIVQDYSQCCARVGSVEYYVEMEPSEFLDNYPHGTYQSMDGYVIGDPCMRMVHNDVFESGKVFCKRHSTGFEDIREPPVSSHASEPIEDGLNIIFENDYPRSNYDLPLSDFDIDLI